MNAESTHNLYADHHQWLNNWLTKRLQNIDDAADLSQDTYVRIIKSGRYPHTPEQSRPFLMQIAKGLVIDLHRRRALEHAYLDALAALPETVSPSAEEAEQSLQLLIKLDETLDNLPNKVRETFVLARFEGLKYSEIAVKLKVSIASVRKYMLSATMACMAVLNDS